MNSNTERLNADLFTEMMICGADALDADRVTVNELNVFPIPDGDTADNMYLTLCAGLDDLKANGPKSLSDAASSLSRGMLFGARGNSGVILSRIFAGLSKGLEALPDATLPELNNAMKTGVTEAYSSVSSPVEGTILTVFRESVEYASERLDDSATLGSYFEDLSSEMKRSLDRTPDLLDVLKQSGVVDSGGAGLLCIFEGMKNALNGDVEKTEHTAYGAGKQNVDVSLFTENDVLSYGYCTEFLLRLTNSKINVASFDENVIKNYLEKAGESVVFFRDGSIIKAHVHTQRPGDVLNEVQKYGEFLTLKIENMNLQHNGTLSGKKGGVLRVGKKRKKYGIVAVAAGDGIKETLLSLGVDEIVDGGQSMNPSADSILRAINNVNAETVFVFPNNSNVILTAKQAAALYRSADVRVIPTKSVGECYSAVSMLDVSSNDTDAIINDMNGVISGIKTGAVSAASRDTEKDGFNVRQGDFIGFSGETILSHSKDRSEALLGLAEKLGANSFDILLIICGKDTSEAEAQNAEKALSEKFPSCEIYMIDGGQPIFDYMITLE